MVPNVIVPKSSSCFCCEICDYSTSRKSQYTRHLSTDKHKILTNPNSLSSTKCVNYECICGKSYKHASTLCAHKKKCNKPITTSDSSNNEFVFDKEFVMMVFKQNSELQTQMMEVIKNGTHNTNTNASNNTSHSHNKTFNLQFFLNETCKNAMNIMDFVDSVKIQLTDLEKVGELGFVDGISNIILKNLKGLDVTERPVHCTDLKREVLYVKDEDKWEKEEQENKKMRRAIKHIAQKNSKLIPSLREKYPNCNKSDSKYSDQYNKVLVESFSGDTENENKIIKKLSKELTIDKE